MSHEFAMRLWALTKLGVGVVIARHELRPEEISDPHLFVHREKPIDAEPATSLTPAAPIPTAPTAAKLLKTAETIEDDQTTDASRQHGPDAALDSAANRPDRPAMRSRRTRQSILSHLMKPKRSNRPDIPLPLSKPAEIAHPAKGRSRFSSAAKSKRIYVRQDFAPLFDAPVSIETRTNRSELMSSPQWSMRTMDRASAGT